MPVGFLRRLDDRVIGAAERDPAARRRADAWANALLILIGVGIATAVYFSDHKSGSRSPAVYVLVGVVVAGAVVRITRSRGR
jgi:peptidoglycan/LPS O-acetylase OafA/YrhL